MLRKIGFLGLIRKFVVKNAILNKKNKSRDKLGRPDTFKILSYAFLSYYPNSDYES